MLAQRQEPMPPSVPGLHSTRDNVRNVHSQGNDLSDPQARRARGR